MHATPKTLARFGRANLDVFMQCGSVAAKGANLITQEYLDIVRRTVEDAALATRSMMACRNPAELLTVQTRYARDMLSTLLADRNRLAELTAQVVRAIAAPIGAQTRTAIGMARAG